MAKQTPSIPLRELPSAAESAKAAFTPISVDVVRDDPDHEALYWFGALPAKGKQTVYLQPADGQAPDLEREDGRVGVQMTALEAWYPKFKGQPPIWLGRCRWYQNLSASGISFVAYSEQRMREAANESQMYLMAWPGSVAKFTDRQLSVILESVRNHAIRPKSDTVAEIVNYMFGHMPGCKGPLRGCTCVEIERAGANNPLYQRAVGMTPERRKPGDLPLADFVYLVRLPSEPNVVDPKLYYQLVPSMEKFLTNPPEPLSADLAKLEKEAASASPV